jgi:hypothetical protein
VGLLAAMCSFCWPCRHSSAFPPPVTRVLTCPNAPRNLREPQRTAHPRPRSPSYALQFIPFCVCGHELPSTSWTPVPLLLLMPLLCAQDAGGVVNITWTPAALIQIGVLGVFTWWLVKYFAMANTSRLYLVSVHMSW